MPSYGGTNGPDGNKKTGDQGQGTRDRDGGNTGGGKSRGDSKKPGDSFGKIARRIAGMMIPGLPGVVVGGGMMVGDMMGDQVQQNQDDVDAGRKRSRRMDDPGMQGMGRVDDMEGEGISSFGNAASDDRAPNSNGLGRGMTGGGGGKSELDGAEERKRRRLASQQTAIGSVFDKLGPGVLPI